MNNIYIDDVGEGYPLVLVHGFLGSSEMWCNQKDFFSNFCRVISPLYRALVKVVELNL